MTQQEDIQKQIAAHSRRLQLLKERKARQGINTDPAVITEIEEIEATLEEMQAELNRLEDTEPQTDILVRTAPPGTIGQYKEKVVVKQSHFARSEVRLDWKSLAVCRRERKKGLIIAKTV
jgi:hypothetical protein